MGPDLHVDMHIDNLAHFMFIRNINNALVELCLGGIENNKDLFYFCLDLFCKGLVLLFGKDGKVDIESLILDDFIQVKRKMALAGIDVKLDIYEIPKDAEEEPDDIAPALANAPPDVPEARNAVNLPEIENIHDNMELKEFVFRLKMDRVIYNISFELKHNLSL
jgi:hypothetical protein